ncbi:MAG: TolC family protein [Verrucomicrobiota bacterium]|nr:TolC family protein [Verrucomicrobiota bacterium]
MQAEGHLVGASAGVVLAVLLLVSCSGVPTRGEREARKSMQALSHRFVQSRTERNLPVLTNGCSLGDYLRFAMLNHPSVEAAYFDWASSIEQITIDRSRPDPRFMFEADIADIVMTVMPGLLQMFPAPGKLKAAASVATASSTQKYFAFEAAVLRTAFNVKRAYYQLCFLDESIRINRDALGLLSALEEAARARNAAGKVALQDVYRAQIDRAKLAAEIENLEDSRRPFAAQFKGALGLTRGQPDPPRPAKGESTPLDLSGDELLAIAFARNPRLKMLKAEVQMAQAAIALAAKSKMPDFDLGLMADARASPPMFRPVADITLPIWRDKIQAQIAKAQADKRAAEARLTAEQISIAVEFAMKSYGYRELTRNLALLQDELIPRAQQSLEAARSGYHVGQVDFLNLIDAERTWLNFRLEEAETRMRREIILADLSLMIAGIAPEAAPVLTDTPGVGSRQQTSGALGSNPTSGSISTNLRH